MVFIVYLAIAVILFFIISNKAKMNPVKDAIYSHQAKRSASAKDYKQEIWKQVYETESMDEARTIKARLEEECILCVLYEQGKKDVHGNALKGVGVATPNSLSLRAQNLISRIPV